MTASVDQLALVLDENDRLVAAVRSDQWDAPTPCTDWTVRDLLNHVAGGNRMFAAALRGEPRPAPQPADDLVTAVRDSTKDVVAAFRLPGVLAREVTVPFGTVPGAVALHLRITEILVHGWDLARATGQPVRFPADIIEQELAFTRGAIAGVPPERRPFAPEQSVADDAPALDRLAALLGRSMDQV
ncbi:MAG TPA: TIGR03086 family metal-binding protein [Pseudonocardiaceae bacterium]